MRGGLGEGVHNDLLELLYGVGLDGGGEGLFGEGEVVSQLGGGGDLGVGGVVLGLKFLQDGFYATEVFRE